MKLVSALIFAMAFAVGCESAPKSAAGLGTAQIKIVAKPKSGVVEPMKHVAVYDAAPKPPQATGEFEHVDYSNLDNIIVWLEPAPARSRGFHLSLKVNVNPNAPSSHIHAAHVHENLELKNTFSKPISLYSVSDGNDFEMKSVAPGASQTYAIRSEGLIEILADPSQPPVALVYAAPSAFVEETRAGKTVVFTDVPPGEYDVVAWHPRLPGGTAHIVVSPNSTVTQTISLGVNSLPHAP